MSVCEFAMPSPRYGSIDAYSGFGNSFEKGIEMHQVIQAQRQSDHPTYEAECSITQTLHHKHYSFVISGKMDGLFKNEKIKIEEIKTSFAIFELMSRLKDAPYEHPYCLQLQTYGYFYWLQHKVIPKLTFHLVSTRNGETFDLPLYLNVSLYEEWLNRRLDELVCEVKQTKKNIKRRTQAAANLIFPFSVPRKGQAELIAKIEEGMQTNRPMLIQAPTGLGKTMGVLYPILKEAMGRGQKVIYITPKNSQHSVAEDATRRLQQTGVSVKALTITAKSKLCFKNEPICNPNYCEFAKDHYTKITTHNLTQLLTKKRSITAISFKKIAKEFQVCPFYLQFELFNKVDLLICDYNYVFANSAFPTKISTPAIGEIGKPNLVIDEAHNLPHRSMDYYSPSLSVHVFQNMLKEIETVSEAYRKKTKKLLESCIHLLEKIGPENCRTAYKISPPVAIFISQDEKLREFLSTYLKDNIDIKPQDLIMRFTYYWSEFTAALEFVSANRKEFFTTFHPHPATIKITCCDASEILKPAYQEFKQIIGFSATLKPFDYYGQLTGLKSDNLITDEFNSPFPTPNRKILIIPQISSKYSTRERHYPRIADVVKKISTLKSGNYFVFLPSFDFLERVLSHFIPPQGFNTIRQMRGMGKREVKKVLEKLNEPNSAYIIFAVQGGIFSEGMDYPGNMIIGAFIVGTALPNFNLERQLMKDYYQTAYSAGFDYAYTYPAMAKAIQAAGRVIRSEFDKGIIILMDDRFAQNTYSQCMPKDWFDNSPSEVISKAILNDIKQFWSQN